MTGQLLLSRRLLSVSSTGCSSKAALSKSGAGCSQASQSMSRRSRFRPSSSCTTWRSKSSGAISRTPAEACTGPPLQMAALTSSRRRRATSSALSMRVPLKLFRYSLKDLLSMMWLLSHGTMTWAMATCGLPRAFSHDSS